MAKINGNGKKHITLSYTEGSHPKICVFEGNRRKFDESYFTTFQKSMVTMSKLKLPGSCWDVFAFLSGIMDFDNDVHVPQKYISEELKIAQQDVSLAIKRLVYHSILIPGKILGTAKTYKLNNSICWKGRVKNLEKERMESSICADMHTEAHQPTEVNPPQSLEQQWISGRR
jgi:ribosomal protein S18